MKNQDRPRFKVLRLPFAYRFEDTFKSAGDRNYTPEECYQFELDWYNEDKEYDGPLKHLERCYDMTFLPAREGLMYCFRNLFNGYKHPDNVWKSYDCYTYQAGMWWRLKEPQVIFTELYVPRMNHYEYSKLKCPYKFLNTQAQKDVQYYRHLKELRDIDIDIGKFWLEFDKREKLNK